MDNLILETRGKQGALVNDDTGRRALSGLEEIGDNAGVIQMPVAQGNFLFDIGALVSPSLSSKFVAEAIVTELHHEVDSHRLVSVIVIVALPDGSEGIDTQFPIVAEVPSQGFHVGPIKVAAEGHALLIGLTTSFYFIAGLIGNDLTLSICQLA